MCATIIFLIAEHVYMNLYLWYGTECIKMENMRITKKVQKNGLVWKEKGELRLKKKLYDWKTKGIQAFLILVLCTESLGRVGEVQAKGNWEIYRIRSDAKLRQQSGIDAAQEPLRTVTVTAIATESVCTAVPDGEDPGVSGDTQKPGAVPDCSKSPSGTAEATKKPDTKPPVQTATPVPDILTTETPGSSLITTRAPLGPIVYVTPSPQTTTPEATTPGATEVPGGQVTATPDSGTDGIQKTKIPSMDISGATATPKPTAPGKEEEHTAAPKPTDQPDHSGNNSNVVPSGNCTIVYVLNGGVNHSKNPNTVLKSGPAVNLFSPKKRGYLFAGWYADSICTRRVYTVGNTTEDKVILYAKWKKVKVEQAKISGVKIQKNGNIYVKVKKCKQVKGYEYLYSTTKVFSRKYRVRTTKNPKELSVSKRGNTYYIKVRAYALDSWKRKVYGSYSAVAKCGK